VERIVELPLSEGELEKLRASAKEVAAAIAELP
jgi:malate/lactate dehydrogenase